MPTVPAALRHPVLIAHAVLVVLLIALDPVLGGDDGNVAQLGLVVLGIPWSAFLLGQTGSTFTVLTAAAALLNVALHAAVRARPPAPE